MLRLDVVIISPFILHFNFVPVENRACASTCPSSGSAATFGQVLLPLFLCRYGRSDSVIPRPHDALTAEASAPPRALHVRGDFPGPRHPRPPPSGIPFGCTVLRVSLPCPRESGRAWPPSGRRVSGAAHLPASCPRGRHSNGDSATSRAAFRRSSPSLLGHTPAHPEGQLSSPTRGSSLGLPPPRALGTASGYVPSRSRPRLTPGLWDTCWLSALVTAPRRLDCRSPFENAERRPVPHTSSCRTAIRASGGAVTAPSAPSFQ